MRLPLSVLSATLVLVSLIACKKDKLHETTPVTNSVVHINYTYLATTYQIRQDSVSQYELILSSGNTIILDTIAAINTLLSADITTPPLADLTTIAWHATTKEYYITTEKAISPGAWSILPGTDSTPGYPNIPALTYSDAYIYYTNVPVPSGERYYFSGSNTNIQTGAFNSAPNDQLGLLFGQTPNFDVYLCFPNKGLYNFHHMSGLPADTVNLSTMDTAISLRMPLPAIYTNHQVFVIGFTDTTNIQQAISVSAYQPDVDTITGADVVYPGYKKVFEKYQFTYVAFNNGYADVADYSDFWADSINPTPIILDKTYFFLWSNTSNNFTVQFPKASPGSYTMQYTGAKFYLTINTPSDSTTLHPQSSLTALNSKMLQNISLSSMQPDYFSFDYVVIRGQLKPVFMAPLTNQYASPSTSLPTTTYSKNF